MRLNSERLPPLAGSVGAILGREARSATASARFAEIGLDEDVPDCAVRYPRPPRFEA
jgi:hypothetical protein